MFKIISRHFGKSNDCFVRGHSASSPKHLERDLKKNGHENADNEQDEDEIEDEIISTSMVVINIYFQMKKLILNILNLNYNHYFSHL